MSELICFFSCFFFSKSLNFDDSQLHIPKINIVVNRQHHVKMWDFCYIKEQFVIVAHGQEQNTSEEPTSHVTPSGIKCHEAPRRGFTVMPVVGSLKNLLINDSFS